MPLDGWVIFNFKRFESHANRKIDGAFLADCSGLHFIFFDERNFLTGKLSPHRMAYL